MNKLFVFVFMFFATSLMADELDLKMEKILYPSVRVLNGSGGGSGTILYSDDRDKEGQFLTFVLTNHHVVDNLIHITRKWDNLTQKWYDVEDNDVAEVELFSYANGGKTVVRSPIKAQIIAYDKDEDLALLQLIYEFEVKNVSKLVPINKSLRLFQEVYAVGCQMLADPFPTPGIVADLEVIIDKKSYVAATAPIYFGSSGGAVYAKFDTDYYFVGIPSRVSMGYSGALSHMGYFIRPERIHEFISRNMLDFLVDETKTVNECFEKRENLRKNKNERSF